DKAWRGALSRKNYLFPLPGAPWEQCVAHGFLTVVSAVLFKSTGTFALCDISPFTVSQHFSKVLAIFDEVPDKVASVDRSPSGFRNREDCLRRGAKKALDSAHASNREKSSTGPWKVLLMTQLGSPNHISINEKNPHLRFYFRLRCQSA